MTARQVNPPPQKLPPDLAKRDPELFKYLEDQQFFSFQIWKRTGGGADYTDEALSLANDIDNTHLYPQYIDPEEFASQVEAPAVQVREFYAAVKTENYTAIDGDFIEARNGITVTLDPSAGLNDQIIIANGDGSKITVSGQIRYTKEDSSILIRQKGTSLHFQNFGDYWRIR